MMLEITSEQVTPALEALFPRTGYVVGHRCFGVLTGTRVGRIFTDDPGAPRWGAVQEIPFDTLFLGGALDAGLVADICTTLRRDRDVVFGAQPGDPFLELMPPGHLPTHVDTHLDLDFTNRSPEIDMERLARTPDGLHLERIDRDLLARCAWGDLMIEMAGSPDQALKHGLGYCLLHNDTIVSEANAGPAARGVIELGTITHPAYRGRGYATIVSARTALECERLGYTLWWNCEKENLASAAIARKLGFSDEHEYRLLVWPKSLAE
jgi:GNAT superfamily N-acetyltransferase